MEAKNSAKRAGRPRAFDVDKALHRALLVFWRKGYEGASLSDLTKAMGINRPSLYAAFGDKEALFREALDRYVAGPPTPTPAPAIRGDVSWCRVRWQPVRKPIPSGGN